MRARSRAARRTERPRESGIACVGTGSCYGSWMSLATSLRLDRSKAGNQQLMEYGQSRAGVNDRYGWWAQWVDATPWLVSNSLIWWHQDPGLASAVDRHSRLHCRKVELRKGLNNKILPVGEQVLRRPVEIATQSGHSRLTVFVDPCPLDLSHLVRPGCRSNLAEALAVRAPWAV